MAVRYKTEALRKLMDSIREARGTNMLNKELAGILVRDHLAELERLGLTWTFHDDNLNVYRLMKISYFKKAAKILCTRV